MTKYQKVAIIGGGPCGLSVAKALGYENSITTIDLYEQKSKLGGLWNYTGPTDAKPPVPSVCYTDEEEKVNDQDDISPMYKYLETNIVKEIMQYKDFPFPNECETFPTREEVLKYVQNYADTIPSRVKIFLNSVVNSVEKVNDETWKIKVSINNNGDGDGDGDELVRHYDAVVLANGHYNQPYIPNVPGLTKWSNLKSDSITHAKYFDDCLKYKDQTVLIIGNSASGLDIATQCSTVAKKVYNSVRTPSNVADVKIENVEEISEVIEYDVENGEKIKTINGDEYYGIDTVIFCTGYLYKFPFLKSYLDGPDSLLTNGERVRRLYKQLFYIPDPSLVTVGLPKSIIVMPFSECQAAIISRVFSGRLILPNEDEQRSEEFKEIEERGEGKEFHNLKSPLDILYCQNLQSMIDSNDELSEGFQAARWDDYRVGLRKQSGPKKASRYEDIVKHANKLRENHEPFRLLRG